jgi:DNA-binding NarL/FixJ family response regulator
MGSPATSDAKKAIPGLSRVRQSPGHSRNRLSLLPKAVTEAHSSRKGTELGGRTGRIRIQISAGNDLFREALGRALSRVEGLDIVVASSGGPTQAASVARDTTDVLVLISREKLQEDVEAVRGVRASDPVLKILFLGTAGEDGEFLQFVRAGISGFLRRDAPTEDIARAIENVHAGRAVCPGELCAALFRFFEDSEPRLPFGSPTQRLGLTRREQQIVPLIAKGFTNKEIANHFCLSEQTVKNHLYRMKHKVGAEDRLSIVQKFRHHGLLL